MVWNLLRTGQSMNAPRACLLALAGLIVSDASGQLVPFVLPWNDATPSLTDFSALNTPIGPEARVTVSPDGHFQAAGKRVRFLGLNFAGDSPFLPTNKAEAVAARLAKFGVNNVRFHHLDAPWAAGGGLLAYTSTSSRTINAAQLERVHFLVARLKAHGIYANLNLLVGREYRSGDGLGAEVTQISDWKDQHVLGFFNDTALGLQQQYATGLLAPTNRFTGLSLARDPAVSFVEIINENGLLQKWFDAGLDKLPPVYASQLGGRWNDWLAVRYADDAALLAAWKPIDEALGANLLKNGAFASGLTSWNPEQHDTARATFTRTLDFTGGQASAKIQVTAVGSQSWHVQFNQPGLRITAGRPYTLTFWAKADQATTLDVAVMRAYGDYGPVGYAQTLNLSSGWQSFTATFQAPVTDANVRVNFGGIGTKLVTVWLADVRFQPGGKIGTLPSGASLVSRTVPNVRYAGDGFAGTVDARKDWVRFLRDLEHRYYAAMVAHVRSLGYPGLIFGTIMANSPATVQSQLDVIDGHAYWQHPQFPRQPWDAIDWTVPNVSLVNTVADDNPLSGLARQRVQGKPFTVTEYQHPSPNQYGAEGPLLLAAYAGLQDWDGLWLFDYGPGNDSVAMGRIRGFFDTAQHPTKMANLLLAAHLFRRADVGVAVKEYTLPLKPDAEIDTLVSRAGAWSLFNGSQLGMPGKMALVSRVNTSVGPDATGLATPPSAPSGSVLTSDTGELRWDLATAGKGLVSFNTPRTKALIGFAANRVVTLGEVTIRPGLNLLGWMTLGLTLTEGDSLAAGGRALLIASGQTENTGMRWKDANKNSVGNQWGNAPTLTEVVPFALTLPVGTNRVRVWTLDPRGQRRTELQPAGDATSATLNVTTNAATIWFEIEIQPPPTGYALWRELNFTPAELADPAASGDFATPANDGVPNLFKYAYGLPAKLPAPPEALPHGSVFTAVDQPYLALSYQRSKSVADLNFVAESSPDLSRWFGGPDAVLTAAVQDLGATERVTVRDVVPVNRAPGRFLRLRVQRMP